jgi:hypothetical protein
VYQTPPSTAGATSCGLDPLGTANVTMVSESGARVGVVVAGGGVVTAPTVVVVVGVGSGMVVVATEMVVVVPAVEAVQAVTTKINRTGRALTWKT